MSFGGFPLGESTLAGVGFAGAAPAPVGGGIGGPPEVPLVIDPFTVELSGTSYKPLVDSLSIEVELGRQGSAMFTLVRMDRSPLIGEPVRIKFYSDIIFVGAIDRFTAKSNNTQTFKTYEVECTDNSYLLFRRIMSRTCVNMSLGAIASALCAEELGGPAASGGDGVTLGVLDYNQVIPLVQGDNVSVYDFLNDAATAVGQVFSIDNDRKLNFRSANLSAAPMTIDENIVEECTVTVDRETYRNEQQVTVTGTPAAPGVAANTFTYTYRNSNQAQAQAAIENTSGVYNGKDSITHPSSNDISTLARLALSYTLILLGVRGSIRQTINVKTRQYGFKVGQLATVSIPHHNISDQYVIQKASYREASGRYLISTLDLSPSSLRRRSQELWIEVVRKAKVSVLPPIPITTSSQIYSTPGTYTFTVPAGILLMIVRCEGAGGGGGGGAYSSFLGFPPIIAVGGYGGAGGLVVNILPVNPGETLTVVIGSKGLGGTSVAQIDTGIDAVGTNGTKGGDSYVSKTGGQVCFAEGGGAGTGARANSITKLFSSPLGRTGAGGLYGEVITVGGGGSGGGGGNGSPLQNGHDGFNGKVTLEW